MQDHKVLILTGPGGSGKSTIAELLVKNCGYVLVDGDQLDTEFFPNGNQWLPENKEDLLKVHNKILFETKKHFDQGKKIVVDYIIFGDYLGFLKKFKKEFGDDFVIKVLFPSEREIIDRDIKRECYTTGAERIKIVRKEFEKIRNKIGEENFINTSGQTPEETFDKYFKQMC